MLLESFLETSAPDTPIKVIVDTAHDQGWDFFATEEEDIVISLSGVNAHYDVTFAWLESEELLHIATGFSFTLGHRENEILKLLNYVNVNLKLGHFDWVEHMRSVVFRHGFLLTGKQELSQEQCLVALDLIVKTCDQYLPAFQSVRWANVSAAQAFNAAVMKARGEA